MKKLVVILLMVAYGAASLGATVHLHYCKDKLEEWGVVKNEGEKCSHKGGMKGMVDDKCCKNLYKQIKVENHYKDAIPIISINKLLIDVTSATNIEYLSISFFSIPTNSFAKQQVQRSNKTKIYILNCVYRI